MISDGREHKTSRPRSQNLRTAAARSDPQTMSIQRTIDDLWTLSVAPRPPTPRERRARVATLARHGGFTRSLSLVAEFVVGAEPLEFSTRDGPKYGVVDSHTYISRVWEASSHDREQEDRLEYLRAFERKLATERRDGRLATRTLRLVGKAWSQTLPVQTTDRLLGPSTGGLAPSPGISVAVPFPFRRLRALSLHGSDFEGQRLLPDWFGNLNIESIDVPGCSLGSPFKLPAPPALPNLKHIHGECATFEDHADGIRDRPLESIHFYIEWFFGGWEQPTLLAALDRAFMGSVCSETLREFRLQGFGKALITLPECLRGLLRLEILDISWLAITELPEWVGEMTLVELDLSCTRIETLVSLRSCLTLRSLVLHITPLCGPSWEEYPNNSNAWAKCLMVPPRLAAPTNDVLGYMPLEDVPADEIIRRTNELMGISLALPDLRIKFGPALGRDPAWHARCGKYWTDDAFVGEY